MDKPIDPLFDALAADRPLSEYVIVKEKLKLAESGQIVELTESRSWARVREIKYDGFYLITEVNLDRELMPFEIIIYPVGYIIKEWTFTEYVDTIEVDGVLLSIFLRRVREEKRVWRAGNH